MKSKPLFVCLVVSAVLHLVVFSAFGRRFLAADFLSPRNFSASPLMVRFRGPGEVGEQSAQASAQAVLVLNSSEEVASKAQPPDKSVPDPGEKGQVSTGKAINVPADEAVPPPPVSTARGLGVPVPRPYYYPAKVLQLSPAPDQRLVFQYPPELAGTKGRVVLAVYINEKGAVDWSEVVESTDDRFTEASKSVIERSRFRPGILGDKFVKSLWLVEVTFAPEGVAAVTSEIK